MTERTVHRWVHENRCPRPAHCQKIAALAAARHHSQVWKVELTYRSMLASLTSTTLLGVFATGVAFAEAAPVAAPQDWARRGGDRCSGCTMFRPPDECTRVHRETSPNGHCRFFAAAIVAAARAGAAPAKPVDALRR